jgi:prevent-host-death family protein
VRHTLKSLATPVARARKNLSDVVAQAGSGQRIKLTRHGKSVAWIVGPVDRAALEKSSRRRTRPPKR